MSNAIQAADARAAIPGGSLVQDVSPFLGLIPADLAAATNKRPVFIPFEVLNLAQNASDTAEYTAPNGVDVVLYLPAMTIRAADNQSAPAAASVAVQIVDNAGKNYVPVGETVDGANIFGTGAAPAVLPIPFIVRGGQTLTFKFTNRYAAAVNIFASLAGFAIGQ